MKKSLFALLLVAAMGLPAAAQSDTQAQPPQAQSQESGSRHHGRKKMDPQARLDRMSKKLNLTPDQQAKILPLLQDESQKAQSLRANTSLSKDDRRAQFRQMHQDTMSQIRSVLNPDQQQKLDAMKAKREKRHGGAKS